MRWCGIPLRAERSRGACAPQRISVHVGVVGVLRAIWRWITARGARLFSRPPRSALQPILLRDLYPTTRRGLYNDLRRWELSVTQWLSDPSRRDLPNGEALSTCTRRLLCASRILLLQLQRLEHLDEDEHLHIRAEALRLLTVQVRWLSRRRDLDPLNRAAVNLPGLLEGLEALTDVISKQAAALRWTLPGSEATITARLSPRSRPSTRSSSIR